MNLRELRNQVFNALDYSPELQAFKNQTDTFLNEAFRKVWTSKRWSFAEAEILFDLHADITAKRDHRTAGLIVNANVVQNSRRVVFSSAMDRLTIAWEGQPIELNGYEYTISEVLSADEIILDTPYLGATNTDLEDWRIKRRYYRLPSDCIEVLSLGQRDVPGLNGTAYWSKVQGISEGMEERLGLRLDETADVAQYYINVPPIFVPPGEKLSLDVETADGQGTDTFTHNSYLEVCWAFEKDGVIGALSIPETVQFTKGLGTYIIGLTAKFTSWDDQEIKAEAFNAYDRRPLQYEGFRKVMFWNANYDRTTGKRLGNPCWKQIITGGTRNSTTYLLPLKALSTESTLTIDDFEQCHSGNRRYAEIDGQHLRIRPYPRVDGWDLSVAYAATTPVTPTQYVKEAILRYYKKPTALCLDTDTPDMPYEFHQLIVHVALEDMYLKLGQVTMAQVYTKRIDLAMKDLERRYVSRVDQRIIKGGAASGAVVPGAWSPKIIWKG